MSSVLVAFRRASDWPAGTNWHIRRALELIA